MPVIINNEQEQLTIPAHWAALIDKVAAIYQQAEEIPAAAEIGLTFVDNAAIQALNREHRDKDTATDVLSFPMYEPDEPFDDEDELLLGDIVISLERAQEQAAEYGHGLEREVMYLLVHGLLHLAGYDHLEDGEKNEMRRREEELLTEIGAIR